MEAFSILAADANKYQIWIRNYLVPNDKNEGSAVDDNEYVQYNQATVNVKEPQIVTWDYLDENRLRTFLELKRGSQIRKFINDNLPKNYPKGFPRIIFCELIYSITKFCKSHNFNLEQTGVILSQFYLTHIYFTSSLNIGPQKLYNYFKELHLCHCLPFPPDRVKLFNLAETKIVMVHFCKLYLRNLPLIRFLSLPNFALCACYKLEPEPVFDKKSKKKGGGKKEKGKKKK